MFDDLMALFQPGRRQLTEERNGLQLDRRDPESGAPRGGIDFVAGTLRIRLAPRSSPGELGEPPRRPAVRLMAQVLS